MLIALATNPQILTEVVLFDPGQEHSEILAVNIEIGGEGAGRRSKQIPHSLSCRITIIQDGT